MAGFLTCIEGTSGEAGRQTEAQPPVKVTGQPGLQTVVREDDERGMLEARFEDAFAGDIDRHDHLDREQRRH